MYYYYNDQWQILCEYTAETTCRQWFSYGNYIDEVLSRNTHPTAMIPMLYYVHDHLYSPAALTNASGLTVWERYEYDAYGKVTITGRGADLFWYTADDVTLTVSNYNNPFTFTGRQLDILDSGALHHMHYRNRDYSPQLGRFMQHDPLRYVDGLNIYEYVNSRPAEFVDPYGLLSTANPCTLAAQGFTAQEIADILGVSLIVVYEATKGKCDPAPPVTVTPCPVSKYGDCTPEQHAALQGAVDSACKSGERRCSGTDSLEELALKLTANSACALARENINGTCYQGGDAGHRQAANDAWRATANCVKKIYDKSRKKANGRQ